jgi:hypothetical protein
VTAWAGLTVFNLSSHEDKCQSQLCQRTKPNIYLSYFVFTPYNQNMYNIRNVLNSYEHSKVEFNYHVFKVHKRTKCQTLRSNCVHGYDV